jgi:phage baseplate assembly protein W
MPAVPLSYLSAPALPLRKSSRGYFQMNAGKIVIDASVRDIIATEPGERVMRPRYGCLIHRMIFEQADTATLSLFRRHIMDAIDEFEPRVRVTKVDADFGDDENSLVGDVYWEFRHSQTGTLEKTDFVQVLGR